LLRDLGPGIGLSFNPVAVVSSRWSRHLPKKFVMQT
jgi:hypothetical protein